MSKQVCLSSWLFQQKSNDITDSSLNSYSEIEEIEADLDEESLVEKESQLSEILDNEDEPMETSCKRQCCDMESAVVSGQAYHSTMGYYGLKLSHLVFSATEQFSTMLQSKNLTIQEAVHGANLATNFLERQRSEVAFELFYQKVLEESKELISEPLLPRYRRISKRFDGGCEIHRYEDPRALNRQEYFEAMETVKGEITRQFQQQVCCLLLL